MLGRKKNEKKLEEAKGKVETILGTGTSMHGDLNTKGSLRIEGKINKGTIKADGDVFIGESGEVNTSIEARNVVVAGKVNGNILALKKIEILPSGNLAGDIKTKVLKIEEGAVFNGVSEIVNKENLLKEKPIEKDKKQEASSTKK